MNLGIESNLLYKPLNIINGISKAGAMAVDFCASLKSEPVHNPILLPTKATEQRVRAKLQYNY